MKRLSLASLFLFVLLVPSTIFAQTTSSPWVNVYGTQVRDAGGGLLASGQFCVQPVDANNRPVIANVAGTAMNATLTSGSNQIVIAAGFQPAGNEPVSGRDIPVGTKVTASDTLGHVTLSASMSVNSTQLVTFGAGALTTGQSCTAITNGSFGQNYASMFIGFTLPDTSATNPSNVCLRVTVTDSNKNGKVIYTAPCFQPSQNASYCAFNASSGVPNCNYDLYSPALPAQVVQQIGIQGPQGPQGPPGAGLTGLASDGASGINVTGQIHAGGAVTLPSDPSSNLQAATKQYVDNHSGTVNPSATINSANAMVQADSVVQSTAYGMQAFGDSITAGGGTAGNGYVAIIGADYSITPTNNGAAGDDAADETWHLFTSLNPSDTGNPIVTSMIGTNGGGTTASSEYQRQWLAGHAWAAMSNSNKILAASATPTGTTSTDTTFANANGKTCTAGPCTFTYTGSVGTPGYFYVWYKMVSSGANLSVTVDGSSATDTVTGSTTISTTWATAPVHQTSTVGLARFAASNTGTAASHTIVVTVQTGGTFLGFGFPPMKRYRGVSHPRVVAAGIPPQQNNANASTNATGNGYNLAGAKTLAADGLDVPFVDVNTIDPVLDMSGTTIQNCTASTNPGLHPNNCGHLHIAQLFESVIGAIPPASSPNIAGPLNITHASAPGSGSAFDLITPHNFNDALIHKINLGSGMFGGVGQYKNPTGGNFGMGIFSDGSHEVGLGFASAGPGSTTAESGFSWPFTLTPTLLQTFFGTTFFKFNSSGLCWGATGCAPIGASSSITVSGSGSVVICSTSSCTVTITSATTFTRVVLSANVSTFTLSWPAVAGAPLMLDICQDGTGGRTLATPTAGTTIVGWPADVIAANDTAGSCTMVQGAFESGGNIYFGVLTADQKYSFSWTPAAATASQCVEQTTTVTGLATVEDIQGVTPPAAVGTHIWIGGARASAANTLAVAFCADATGGTPPSGTWRVIAR